MQNSYKPLFFSYTNEFLNVYLPQMVCRSRHTVESYTDSLSIFRRFINTKGISQKDFLFENCTPDLMNDFKLYLLDEKHNRESTVNGRITAVRSYIDFAASKDASLASVAIRLSGLRKVSEPKLEKKTLTPEQVTAIIAAAPQTRLGVRNRMMFLLMYESAVRVSELVGLKVSNVRIADGHSCLYIIGKGRKERFIPLLDSTASLLKKYILEYHGSDPNLDAPLFYGLHGGQPCHLTTRSVQMLLSEYSTKARATTPDIPENVHPHMLRRSKATTLYQTGTPLPLIASILGHSHMETTRIYATPSMEMKKAAMDRLVPVSFKDEKPIWQNREDEEARKNGLR